MEALHPFSRDVAFKKGGGRALRPKEASQGVLTLPGGKRKQLLPSRVWGVNSLPPLPEKPLVGICSSLAAGPFSLTLCPTRAEL